jgi:hypothetical protein
MQCSSGYFISGYETNKDVSTATTCTSTCAITTSTGSPAVIVDDMLGFVNICLPYAASGFAAGGRCARYGRYRITAVGSASVFTDYDCFMVSSTTGSLPSNYLLYSVANAITQLMWYESPSDTTPISTPTVTGIGYSNTVDSSSLTPNVFNYLGLLTNSLYGATQAVTVVANGATALAAANLNFNSLANCDIVGAHTAATGLFTRAWYSNSATAALVGYTAGAAAHNFCVRCQFGYQLSLSVGASTSATSSYPSCTQMTNCASASTVYGGLPQFLNTVLSCHVCSPTSGGIATYPTIYIETEDTKAVFFGYQVFTKITATANVPSIVDTNNGFRCGAALTSLVNSAGTAVTVTNCAVYGNIERITATGSAAPAFATAPTVGAAENACLACAANYWPTYGALYGCRSSSNRGGWYVRPARPPRTVTAE